MKRAIFLVVGFAFLLRPRFVDAVPLADLLEDAAKSQACSYEKLAGQDLALHLFYPLGLSANQNRVAVAGDSAGGHLAARLSTIDGFDDPNDDLSIDRRANVMLLYNAIVELTEDGWLKFAIGSAALVNHPEAASTQPTQSRVELARRRSPLFHVAANQPPCLLMHGLDDNVVSLDPPRAYADAMKKAGNRCDLVFVEQARHAFVVPKYKASESTVVNAIVAGDRFVTELGFLDGEPTLTVSTPPAWTVKPPHK